MVCEVAHFFCAFAPIRGIAQARTISHAAARFLYGSRLPRGIGASLWLLDSSTDRRGDNGAAQLQLMFGRHETGRGKIR